MPLVGLVELGGVLEGRGDNGNPTQANRELLPGVGDGLADLVVTLLSNRKLGCTSVGGGGVTYIFFWSCGYSLDLAVAVRERCDGGGSKQWKQI